MKIGILGTRGIPNHYSGFEQFAARLSFELTQRGHTVYVYNSHNHPYQHDTWNGVHIIHCNDPEHKLGTFGQFIYDYNCIKDARSKNFDILMQLGYTSSSVWYPLWPRTINLVNMDGMEWKRAKYNRLTRLFLKLAERLAGHHANLLIADSAIIKDYLDKKYKKEVIYIPYGADPVHRTDPSIIKRWALEEKGYFLVMARMEPENNIEMVVKGYLLSKKKYPLVIVSNAANSFGKYMRRKYNDPMIRFIGAVYDQEAANSLRQHSKLYFHGHSVGGTNPSLLEAMAAGCNISVHDNPFNRSIMEEGSSYFSNATAIASIMDT